MPPPQPRVNEKRNFQKNFKIFENLWNFGIFVAKNLDFSYKI